ncbi:mycofactocin precursor MftA [Streptomyces sp. WI04-05B]|nr:MULTISPECIES: mycofactocin precursor MftA [unclassified Streptomyces]MDX2545012.1 mycofactocin precursor MftA [Streptomyces sp. WI04-05B]MDX2587503.1 mycofactocin precursor MftA [Streptomyces sp. WI04-05A]MDX3748317.1 mycofactocin precursor MftA [Streptomyces sp. AK08-02]
MNEFHDTRSVPASEIQDARTPAAEPPEPLIEADDLIEEVSIDGMCGVY